MARRADGFTLIEVLVAMFILAIGVTGVLGVFTTGVGLQKEATERMDVALMLPGILDGVQEELSRQARGEDRDVLPTFEGRTFVVPGWERYHYRVRLEQDPNDPTNRVWLCSVELLAPPVGEGRVYAFPYLPIVPEEDNDARIRALLGNR